MEGRAGIIWLSPLFALTPAHGGDVEGKVDEHLNAQFRLRKEVSNDPQHARQYPQADEQIEKPVLPAEPLVDLCFQGHDEDSRGVLLRGRD